MNGESFLTCVGVDIGMPKWVFIQDSETATVISPDEAERLKESGIYYIAYFLLSREETDLANRAFSEE